MTEEVAPPNTTPADALVESPTRLVTPRFLLVVTCGLFYFLAVSMMVPVIPDYVEHSIGAGSISLGIVGLAFSVGAISLRLFAGRIGDQVGRRVLIIGGALVVAVATLAYGFVHAVWWMVLLRVITGFGEAGFFVGAATMITDLSPPERMGEAISYWSIAVYGGFAFGPVIGDFARGTASYERAFLASAAFAFAAAVIGLLTVEVPREIDPSASGSLVNRGAVMPGTVLFLGLIPLAAFSFFMPLYAQDELGIHSGQVFLLYGVLILVVRIFGARIPDRLGGRGAGSLALVFASTGIGIIAAWPTVVGLVVGTFVLAAGMSLLYPAMFVLALTGVSDSERAAVVATVSSFFDASQGVGAFICGAVVAVTGNRGAFVTGAVMALLGLALLRTRTS